MKKKTDIKEGREASSSVLNISESFILKPESIRMLLISCNMGPIKQFHAGSFSDVSFSHCLQEAEISLTS